MKRRAGKGHEFSSAWRTLATVTVTGKLTRWLLASPRTATATAGFGAAAANLVLLVVLASELT